MKIEFHISFVRTYFQKVYWLYVFLLGMPVFLLGQSYDKELKKATENFEALAYVNARDIYLEVAKKGFTSYDLLRKLADSYYFTGEPEQSVSWYKRLVIEYEDSIPPEYLFRYAQSLKSIKLYKDADRVMEKFDQQTGYDRRAKSFINKRDYLDFIKLQSGRFTIFPLSINSRSSDYAPSFIHNNTLVFASTRGKNSKKHEWNNMPFLDLYETEYSINNNKFIFSEPKKLKGKINTKYHESSTTFTEDGNTVYFTRNNYSKNRLGKSNKGVVLLKIYSAKKINDVWKNIKEVPFNSDNYSTSHPALSQDGKKLYFASDMPGTKGKSDIFYVDILPDGTFSKPKNLGNRINTEGRETFPFISEDGVLYFSSNGHVGLGGLDVFMAKPENNIFSEAFNVGKPVNSSKDDFTFILKNKKGFFASNRKNGKGNDDIYAFEQIADLLTECKEYVKGIVVDDVTKTIIQDIEVVLLDLKGNLLQSTRSDVNGEYKFRVNCNERYIVRTSLPDYNPIDQIFESTDSFEKEHSLSIFYKKEKLLSPETTAVKKGEDLVTILDLNPIFFDLNDDTIRPDAVIDLQKVIAALQKNPELKIEVRSHTDSRSSYWYNKRLSVRRMRATIAYLVENGSIYWRRIRGKAYGERRLLNHCDNTTPCSENEHQENRRSEFIVIR